MDLTQVQKFYRFHPVTGQDANEFDTKAMAPKDREELANMVRHGARFYWERDVSADGGYSRVEKANIEFVLELMGAKYEFLDTRENVRL